MIVGGIALESAYAGFSRGNVTDNEDVNPGYGYTVDYHGDMGEATVYVYGKSRSEIPDGVASQVVMDEFDLATQDVLSFGRSRGRTVELVERYGTGSPEGGKEFLCAEFVQHDESGSRRTFLYMTGAANQFVKIRVTLRTNDARDPAARNFADAVGARLWRNSSHHHEVLGLVRIATFGRWWWHREDFDQPTMKGAVFRCYEGRNEQELGYLLVVDVSGDPDEPDVARLRAEHIEALDRVLEAECRKLMANDGRRLIRWMSSTLNETAARKGLVTAYVAEDQGRERQYIDLRTSVRNRKVVVAGCFDVERARDLAGPIFSALQNAAFLAHEENS